jgi:transposase-like protein
VIVVAVRWYLRFNLSYRDIEELLVERDVEVDHVTVYRWVRRFAPLLADAARFARRSPGDRWFVDETYVKANGVWRYVYRAIDQHGQVIDVLVSARRDTDAARRFFRRALSTLMVTPSEVVTDRAAVYPGVLAELIPSARHRVEQYANNPIEADHGQLKHRLRPPRGPVCRRHGFSREVGHHPGGSASTRTKSHNPPRARPCRGRPRGVRAPRRGSGRSARSACSQGSACLNVAAGLP